MDKRMIPQITDALSNCLDALGFKRMAREAKSETDPSRIARYARIIHKNAPTNKKEKLAEYFGTLRIPGFEQFDILRINSY